MSLAAVLRAEPVPALPLVGTIAVGGAFFGAAVGSYVGGCQIAFAAVKMPLFLLGTLAICMAALGVLASSSIGPAAAMNVALRTIATTAVLLGGLAGPVFLAGLSLPKPEPRAYSAMVLLLTLSIGDAGTIGAVRLRRSLGSWRLWFAWIGIYGFVGAQMAWLLKPWIGHTLVADRFIPLAENLHGNFYEAAWGVLVHLMR